MTLARSLATPEQPPWVEYEDKQLALHRVDPKRNAHRARPPRHVRGIDALPFDPVEPLVEELLGRNPKRGKR